MATIPLHDFITTYRPQLIRRCKDRSATRSTPPATVEVDHGVPLILEQLVKELRSEGHTETNEIIKGAAEHGHDLLLEGFTVSQVVHDYGDVCQAVTDLAVELDAPIDTEDFRTMNRCLDDAIASAVTEHARGQDVARDGESDELRNLITTAITAFDVLETGSVGITGRTGGVLKRSLAALRVFADRQSAATPAPMATPRTAPVRTRQ
jgi:hypothetical protein